MMRKPNVLRISALVLIGSVLGFSSCKEEEPTRLSLQDTADLTEEALTDAYFQDMDDIAGIALSAPSDAEYSNGRTRGTITIEDHRFDCDAIIVTIDSDETSTAEVPKGVLAIDFGTSGCTDLKGNVRTGKLIFTYHGKRFMPGSTVVTTVDEYTINGVKLEGTRTLTNLQASTSAAPRFNVLLEDGKATFQNSLVATREADITWQWNRAQNPLDDNLEIESTSTASGTTRGGRNYEVILLENLIYKRDCGIAVSGIKKYTIDGEKEITLDYGDGTCDRNFSITVNGMTSEISL
jgi:hypothetical protein